MGETAEKKYRKCQYPAGTWVRLADGELWCVSSMPIGAGSEEILAKTERVFELQKNENPEEEKEGEEVFSLENFPSPEAFKKALEDKILEQKKKSLARTREFLSAGLDFAETLLRFNYPGLPENYPKENNLLTLQHINLFVEICQGGTKIGDVLGEQIPGEAMCAAGRFRG